VFDTSTAQDLVYEEIVPHARLALRGRTVGFVCYGESGSGKTYTLLGTPKPGDEGIVQRTLATLLASAPGRGARLRIGGVELVGDTMRDLLAPSDSPAGALSLVRDTRGVTVVQGQAMLPAPDMQAAMAAVMAINAARSVPHLLAHMLLTVTVTSGEDEAERVGRVIFADLAGADVVQQTVAGELAVPSEPGLAGLHRVVTALVARQDNPPFRDVRLTALLRDAVVGGAARPVFLCHVAPGTRSLPASRATLAFASRLSLVEMGRTQSYSDVLAEHGLAARADVLRQQAAAAAAAAAGGSADTMSVFTGAASYAADTYVEDGDEAFGNSDGEGAACA
jgi:kinesin family protein C2/C3